MACGFMALMAHRRCLAITIPPIGLSCPATSQGTVQPRAALEASGPDRDPSLIWVNAVVPTSGDKAPQGASPPRRLGYPGAVHGRQL